MSFYLSASRVHPRAHDLTRKALIDYYEKKILLLENEVQGLRNIITEMQQDIQKIKT